MRRALHALPLLVLPGALASQAPTDTVELNPVVVTATRIPTPAANLPVAVTVISGEQLRAQGIRMVAEALRTVPALTVVATNAYGSQTSLFLRGGESDYVKVLIDGVPQNVPGGAYDFANLTTDNVERIEVVRGPASVLYGSDAVTGVVQIFTRDGRGAARGSLAVTGGTYGSNAVDATFAGAGERAGYALGMSRFSSDGVYPINNQYRNDVLSVRTYVRPNERTDAAVSLRYGNALYHFPTDGSGDDTVSNNQHQLERGPTVGVDFGHVFSARVEGRLAADWHRANYQYAIGPNGPTDTTTFPFSSSDWVTRTGLDARLNVRLPARDVVTAGAALERQTMTGTTLDRARSRNSGAIYLQLVTLPVRPVSLTVGARLEENQRFGTYATYRTGLSVRIADGTRAIASVGTGFKEPSFYENFATGFVQGNPDLRPEHSFSWETGLEHTIRGGSVIMRATYFDQRFRDLIDYNGADSVTNYFNVPGADARGVEVTAEAALGTGVHVSTGYTFLHTQVTKGGAATGPTALFRPGQTLIRRPEHSAMLGFTYRLPARGSVVLTMLYTGDREDIDYATFQRVPLPSHARVDLATQLNVLRLRAGAPGLTLSARVENLLDHAYEDVKNFPARGRTVLLGGRLGWGL